MMSENELEIFPYVENKEWLQEKTTLPRGVIQMLTKKISFFAWKKYELEEKLKKTEDTLAEAMKRLEYDMKIGIADEIGDGDHGISSSTLHSYFALEELKEMKELLRGLNGDE